jgi:RNA polymerase sigma-70 factor (ECF subfamily)
MRDDDFRAFYEKHARRLWAYVAKCSGRPPLADDVVQEAFIRMLAANLPVEMTEEHRKNYLYKIATNLLHRGARSPRYEELPGRLEAPRESLDDVVAVRRAMNGLGRSERGLLWLAYVENLSHRDIAAILGYRENSIRPLLHRAKTKLIGLLEGRSPHSKTEKKS